MVCIDAAFSSAWPPLLLLSDLYTRSLLAMDDDELFSIESDATTASRNQLTRVELVDFSKKLLNIAYALWSKEDQRIMKERAPGINLKWEGVRERVTTCLQVIHARE
jgi:ubiquitin-protein ligase E3 C